VARFLRFLVEQNSLFFVSDILLDRIMTKNSDKITDFCHKIIQFLQTKMWLPLIKYRQILRCLIFLSQYKKDKSKYILKIVSV